jgi:hypothetical protein
VVPTEGNRADVDELTPNNPTSDFLSMCVEGWEVSGYGCRGTRLCSTGTPLIPPLSGSALDVRDHRPPLPVDSSASLDVPQTSCPDPDCRRLSEG